MISPRVVDVVDPVDAVLEVTDELTDADLCRAWRSSYVALDRATESNQKLRAVQIRALLLDTRPRTDRDLVDLAGRLAALERRVARAVDPA